MSVPLKYEMQMEKKEKAIEIYQKLIRSYRYLLRKGLTTIAACEDVEHPDVAQIVKSYYEETEEILDRIEHYEERVERLEGKQ